MPHTNVVLSLSCRDQPGIVAAVAKTLFDAGCNVVEAHQFNDAETHLFFMRMRFAMLKPDASIEALKAEFEAVANDFGLTWTMRSLSEKQRVMILVSKFDHCLADLLYRWRIGEIDDGDRRRHRQPSARDLRASRSRRHPVPLSAGHQGDQDGAGGAGLGADPQPPTPISSCWRATCRCCRTGCAPSWPGAASTSTIRSCRASRARRPYHQAFARGVKLIGATAHYVTPDLDEGPIIEQDVERISHHNTRRGSGSQGPRHRAPRAGPRHHLAHRRPRHRQRLEDGGVQGLRGRLRSSLRAKRSQSTPVLGASGLLRFARNDGCRTTPRYEGPGSAAEPGLP